MNLICCIKTIYCYMEDYVNSIITVINSHKLLLFNTNGNFSIDNFKIDKINNYIFIQDIPLNILNQISDEYNNIYLINVEQLSVNDRRLKINNYPKYINMIDYNKTNLKFYNKSFKIYTLPYQINYNEIYNIKKTKTICIIGDSNIPHNRKFILDLLREKNVEVDIISGFNKIRDNQLFNYKIILNIGYNDNYKIMETFRCDRCIYNKMIVISDTKYDIDDYYLKQYVIFEDYSKLTDKIIEVINNYENIYNTLFSNLNYKNIEKDIKLLSNDIISKLNI